MTRAIRPDELYVAQTAVGYRPFVDGLRAISILAVVGYHVGLPGTTGGYVGVDVFFVISGFLIISQIIDGLHSGNFTFGEFWARRAFRILPTYLLVLAASVALSPFFLVMPEEFRAFSREVRDAGLMIINHLFLEQQGYFDRASDTKPLLHLWSLSVEEQFYLAAPCLLATLWLVPGWLGRPGLRLPTLFWAAVLVFSTSLAGCIVFTRAGGSNFGFYLTVLRAWEFVAGGACAFLLPFAVRLPRHVLVAIGVAGLAAIAFAVGFFQHDTLYPSWRALLPVLGSVAVIVAGLAHPDAMMMRLLATPSMVFIGLVSYAWYLWHWPLLAFARIRNLGERDLPIDLGIAVLSFVLAVATFYILEKPIRRWRRRHARSIGWRPVFAGVAACGLAAFLGYQAQHALAQRQDAVIASRYRPQETASGRYCDLMKESGETCLAEAEGRPVGLLIGDSQMVFARDVLSERMQAAGVSAASMAALACPPFLDVHLFMNDVVMAADCN
jgi:peptidoglycan/LPS O-acetylase OafA/YrhL